MLKRDEKNKNAEEGLLDLENSRLKRGSEESADGLRDLVMLVPAAGKGFRLFEGHGHVPKAFLPVNGRPLILRTLEVLATCPGISRILVGVPRGWKKFLEEEIGKSWWAVDGTRPKISIFQGGRTRFDTVSTLFSRAFPAKEKSRSRFKGREGLTGIHDGVRPLVSHDLVQAVAEAARRQGGAVPLMECEDTIKIRGENCVLGPTLDRDNLGRVQTPQVFHTKLLGKVLSDACAGDDSAKEKFRYSGFDEALLFQQAGYPVAWVAGEAENIKLTWSSQIPLVESLLRSAFRKDLVLRPPEIPEPNAGGEEFRVGVGFDAHRFVAGRPLFLGGVKVAHDMGLDAHSDGDVLVHAIADAVLGAAALGDIGGYFPSGRPETKDLPGDYLLRSVLELIAARGWRVCFVDSVIITQTPTISPYRDRIRKSLAEWLGISVKQVSVKATSTDGIGFAGRREGMAVQAAVVIKRLDKS